MPRTLMTPAVTFRAQIAAVVVAFIVIFHNTISTIVKGWLNGNETGFLILAVTIYMIWVKRAHLKRAPFNAGIMPGSVVTVLGCLLFLAGKVSCTSLAENIALVVVLMGLVWLMCGNQYTKMLCVPLGYLLFMFGLFEELLGKVSIHLQYISAWIASAILAPMGMPVLLSGRYIEMPHINLEVAEACSGVHHIVALVAMAVPLAWTTQRRWLGKVGLVGAAFFVGIFANGLRVALIGLWSSYRPGDPLHGPFEIFYATFIAGFGMAVLMCVSRITSRFKRKGREAEVSAVAKDETTCTNRSWKTAAGAIALGILLVTIGISLFYPPAPVQLKPSLRSFPTTIGPWSGQEATSPPLYYEQMASDDSLRRTYRDQAGHEIGLYIATFAIQQPGRKVVDDRFRLPQQGAELTFIALGDDSAQVRRVVHTAGQNAETLYYWYDVNGRILTDRYRTKAAHVIDAFTSHKTNASLVVVSVSPAIRAADGRAPGDVECQFLELILPVTRTFLNDV